MKFKPDCVRDILIAIESMDYGSTYSIPKLNVTLPQYSAEELNYHCIHLIDAELINADSVDVPLSVLPEVSRIYDLTYSGHQFLANIRSDNIWNGTKTVAAKIGSTALDALIQISSNVVTELIKAQFNIH